MLPMESSPTKPAATAAFTAELPSAPRKKSWIIGEACSRMPMPAVTFRNNAVHTSQKLRVLMAFAAETWPVVTIAETLARAGSQPCGFQPGAGTRMLATPYIITAK